MEAKLGLGRALGAVVISMSVFTAIACGDESKPAPDGAAGADDRGESQQAGRGSIGNGGDGSGGTDTAAGARPNVDPGGPEVPGGPDDPGDPDQPGAGGGGNDSTNFDGVDLSKVSDTAPSGCVGGFDPDAGTLAITVGDEANVVRLAVHGGVVQANGVDCESESGEPATAEKVLRLSLSGSDAADAVYLDLSEEPFVGCFSGEGGIRVDLGAGADTLTILGTNGRDMIHAGTEMGAAVFDLTGDDRADLSIEGAPELVLSTGAKADEVRCDGAALKIAALALPIAIYGGGAGDALVGGAAADRLFGGIGNDWFDAGVTPHGADTFDGGDGRDTVDFSARREPLVITMGDGADDGEDTEQADVTDSVEDVYGGQADNRIVGGTGSNTIWGGPADDVLSGGDGNDTVVGGDGNDTLEGGAGNDYLYGEAGDDQLDGGGDDDLLDGGEGKNTLNGGPSDGDICIATKLDKAAACEL